LIGDLEKKSFQKYRRGNWDVHVFGSCTSTFDIARQLTEAGAGHGTLIVSDIQTGGRGRQSRKWLSPSGGLWMGTVLKSKLEVSKISSVTLLCAVAVARAIEEVFPNTAPMIKWPNDIYMDDKKICGILTETVLQADKVQYVIAGIGINANNTTDSFEKEIKDTSISFKDIGIQVNRAQMASIINDNLLELIAEYENSGSLEFIREYYTGHMQWLGKEALLKNTITGKTAGSGTIRGIDTAGQLLIETEDAIEQIISGELSLRSI
jgi:BirA family biotin operon repressor/biotin-[acetyl-CoA-carboxylase] ligase